MQVDKYLSKTARSREAYERARMVLPAGVTYRIRFFEPYPFYVAKADGSRLYDLDGNSYIDFWCAHFSLILGHRHPKVVEAIKEQLDKGYHYGLCHEMEVRLAEQVVKMVPSAKMVRFSNSGTEANMYAVRLARTFTKRVKIAKFEGNWHGGYDSLHIAVKPPLDKPQSGGLAEGALKDTVVLPYNDLEGVRKAVKGLELASMTIEPVMGAGGMIPADKEFLKGLRELCDEIGALLIFDEVITGFRLSPGGAQQLYGVLPDLTVLGKIVGGGLPIGAIAGRGEVMEHMDHLKYAENEFSFHGGTGVGNPLCMVAGYSTLKTLENQGIYHHIGALGRKAREGLRDIFDRRGVDVQITGLESLFCCHFVKEGPVKDIHAASMGDRKLAEKFHRHLLSEGILFIEPRIIHGAISAAHSYEDINSLLMAAENFSASIN